jgi:hypothetical protein
MQASLRESSRWRVRGLFSLTPSPPPHHLRQPRAEMPPRHQPPDAGRGKKGAKGLASFDALNDASVGRNVGPASLTLARRQQLQSAAPYVWCL